MKRWMPGPLIVLSILIAGPGALAEAGSVFAGAGADDPVLHAPLPSRPLGTLAHVPAASPAQTGFRAPLGPPAPPVSAAGNGPLRRILAEAFSPSLVISSLAFSGFDHFKDTPDEWEQDAGSFGKRVVSRVAERATRASIETGVNILLRQDSSFRPCACEGTWARIGHALTSSVVARDAKGRPTLAVGNIAGAYGSSMLATAWKPNHDASDGLKRGSLTLGIRAGMNLVREFWPDLKGIFD